MATTTIRVPLATSQEAGFPLPVLLSQAVWDDCVKWSKADTECTGIPQDEDGRLWDVLWMARPHRHAPTGERRVFRLHRWSRTEPADVDHLDGEDDPMPPLVTLVATYRAQPGQQDPALVIEMPDEAAVDPHANCTGYAWQQVTCDRCGRTYQCTPSEDFYCAAEGDHCCEPCLLVGVGVVGVVTVIDVTNHKES